MQLAICLARMFQYWSNFWGDVSKDGFYKRAPDYFNLVKRERQGLWNVAFVNHLVAIRGDVIKDKCVILFDFLFRSHVMCSTFSSDHMCYFLSNTVPSNTRIPILTNKNLWFDYNVDL